MVGAIGGSAALYKLAGWLYVEFIRPRLDRFVRDSRVRSGLDDDAITLALLERNGAAVDTFVIGALARDPDGFEHAVAGALERTALEHGAFLRERIFAPEIQETARFRARIEQSFATLDAVAAGLEGVSAAQLAQGHALLDVPHLSEIIRQLTRSIDGMGDSMQKVTEKLDTLGIGQAEMRGALTLVQSIVLGSAPPPGVPEQRHHVRRAEDVAAAALMHDLRTTVGTDPGDGSDPHSPEGTR